MSTPAPTFDARPLTDPIDRADLARFRSELPRGRGWTGGATAIVAVVGALIAVNVLFSVVTSVFLFSSTGNASLPPSLLILGVLAAAGAVMLLVRRASIAQQYRIARFARANGMAYVPRVNAPALPGLIFGVGRERAATEVVRGTRPRFVEFGNHTYATGSGRSRQTHRWGYVAIRLDAPLPHIVLDALSNNGLAGSNLPALGRDQRLSLEGDFDRHFALYCPEGYERDALYLFTPDIMARFLDNAAQLDVEIVDDWLFLYSRRDLSTTDPATWAWLFSVVAALLDKLAQWGRWRDERLAAVAPSPEAPSPDGGAAVPFAGAAALTPPKGVAQAGRRLKRGVNWGVLAIVGGLILVQVLRLVLG